MKGILWLTGWQLLEKDSPSKLAQTVTPVTFGSEPEFLGFPSASRQGSVLPPSTFTNYPTNQRYRACTLTY
jgi:hypothetical protein